MITFFFRKPSEVFHSIEGLFNSIIANLPEGTDYRKVYLPYHTGFLGRLKNIFFVRKNKSEINHITGDVNYIALGLPKKRTVLTIHDIGSALSRKKLKVFFIKFFWFTLPFKRVEKITVISEFSKNQILEKFKVDKRKIVVIPNCVSDDFRRVEKEFNEEKPVILVVGTKDNKNLSRIVKALNDIKCKLVIVGRLRESQIELLKENKIDYDNFVGVEKKKMVELYAQSDLLLFPSTYEGFGLPVIEGQATGIPVITSDLLPMNEVAGDGALLVNPFNVDDIRDGVKKIIEDAGLRKKLIEKGLENVKKYRCKEVAEQYLRVYESILT